MGCISVPIGTVGYGPSSSTIVCRSGFATLIERLIVIPRAGAHHLVPMFNYPASDGALGRFARASIAWYGELAMLEREIADDHGTRR